MFIYVNIEKNKAYAVEESKLEQALTRILDVAQNADQTNLGDIIPGLKPVMDEAMRGRNEFAKELVKTLDLKHVHIT